MYIQYTQPGFELMAYGLGMAYVHTFFRHLRISGFRHLVFLFREEMLKRAF